MKPELLFIVVALAAPFWLAGFVFQCAANWFYIGCKNAADWADEEIEAMQEESQ